MNNNANLPLNGAPVKTVPNKGAFGRPPKSKIADLDAKRKEVQVETTTQWLSYHSCDSQGRPKPPSIDSIYAEYLCSGQGGLWACQADQGTGAVIHSWNGIYWKAMNTEVGVVSASNWLESHARHSASATMADKNWKYAAVRLRAKNPLPVADPKRAIVPCADGYIEISTDGFQVLQPDPELGMVHAVNIESKGRVGEGYVPERLPVNSLFHKFLAHALPDPNVRAVVQEQCGMTLLPGNYSQAAWWYGKAGSGKSTLAELVEAMHRQAVRINLDTLGDRFSLEPLIGASLILVDEVECEKWAEGRFKTVVSGNGIGVDRKNEKALASYHSKAKWIITSNGAPFVRDKSDGVWRRLTVVHWGVSVDEKDRVPDLQKKILEKEGKLVLDWMLEGARRIVARGRPLAEHELPADVQRAKRGARHNSDSVRGWAYEQRVSQAPGNFMPLAEVYKHYESWCEAQGFTPSETLTSRQFWRGMADAGLVDPSKKVNRRVHGKQVDHYELQILGRVPEGPPNWEEDTIDTEMEVAGNPGAKVNDEKLQAEVEQLFGKSVAVKP